MPAYICICNTPCCVVCTTRNSNRHNVCACKPWLDQDEYVFVGMVALWAGMVGLHIPKYKVPSQMWLVRLLIVCIGCYFLISCFQTIKICNMYMASGRTPGIKHSLLYENISTVSLYQTNSRSAARNMAFGRTHGVKHSLPYEYICCYMQFTRKQDLPQRNMSV